MGTTYTVRKLWIPMAKTEEGFTGLLATSALDRDDEIIDGPLIKLWALEDTVLPILLDHENKVESNVGIFMNKQAIENDGHVGLQVTPKFFLSNPKAQMVKAMLEEGAAMGLSVGFMPTESEERVIDGKSYTVFTKGELVEGSFTPVPSNRLSYMNVAKMFGLDNESKVCKCGCSKQKSEHSAEWNRLVKAMRDQGGAESPEAACTAALGDKAFVSLDTNSVVNKNKVKSMTEKDKDVTPAKAVPSIADGEQQGAESREDVGYQAKAGDRPATLQPTMSCPDGYKLEGNSCVLQQAAGPKVPPGQDGSKDGKSVEAQIQKAIDSHTEKYEKELTVLREKHSELEKQVGTPVRKAFLENAKPETPTDEKQTFEKMFAGALGVTK